MIYILAGTQNQAKEYAMFKHIPPSKVRIVDSAEKIRGLDCIVVLLVGTYQFRDDWNQLKQIMLAHRIIFVEDPSW